MTDMTIPTCPGAPVCATCGPVSWMWSLRRQTWVAFIPDRSDRETYRLHRCEFGQDVSTWRQLPHGTPPNDLYVEAKNKITGSEKKLTKEF